MEASTVKVCEAGEVIFREGEKGDLMYVLLEGAVELKKKVERGETVLKIVNAPNDFFGEMALLDDRPRSATAVAEKRCKLLLVDRPSFEAMILQNGKFALKIIKVLSERIRRSNDQVSELIETLPKERIARGMADYARKHGERIHDGGTKVAVALMSGWINSHLGVPPDEIEAAIYRMVKAETIVYAATSAKTKEHLVLSEEFLRENDRRSGEPEDGAGSGA
ncbi:MAG: Crp/Fnr family transcriptional regulator [Spirochaetaceae bacterium]|nr:Crp/Fnr family transcriptional regulator [Spirochaetaceae bacterium]